LFKYLGNTSYERELDVDNKLNNYLKITGILNNVFRPQKTLKQRRLKLYNTLALKYMKRTAGYTWTDYKTNTQIAKELKVTPILDKLLE
jgi:hypothetical protein